tara:strand:+ start:21316 stop:22515 length:1200 start_codon:yes stop_codon:yes gene_type:complete
LNKNFKKSILKDPLYIAKKLIKFPSETPKDEGVLFFLEDLLKELGFKCYRMPSGKKNQKGKDALVNNLYATKGKGKNLCFAGHVDVVPAGNISAWKFPPYKSMVHNGYLYGRGAADMKGAIAAFVAASARYMNDKELDFNLSLLITGDEEGIAEHGTKSMLPRLKKIKKKINHCIVGEPTNPNKIGEMIKIGRRGSLHGNITIIGVQGHVAYPDKVENPLPIMSKIVKALSCKVLDKGNKHFQASNLEFLSIDTGNIVDNVIPSEIKAKFNIRFNTLQTEKKLRNIIIKEIKKEIKNNKDIKWNLELALSGEPFLTKPNEFTNIVSNSVFKITGVKPELSTSGGTSDARFIKNICPVIEFGSVGKTMHKINEKISIKDLESLTKIYYEIINGYQQIALK